jgi:hypothetical protein
MSDDLVNQITLNYLISKSQLQKLNNKIKQKEQDAMKTDKEIYKEQINELFTKCLNDEFPDDLLQDVRNSFTYFIEKSVYYLKIKANQSNENAEETVISVAESSSAAEEEDEDEDAVISEAESLEEDEEAEEDAVISEAESLEAEEEEEAEEAEILEKTQRVFKKSSKPVHSEGVEDINKLPLDWFTKVKYNQNQIKKLKEKKNITNVYENKKNKK